MMLNEIQVIVVVNKLQEAGLSQDQDELIDHVCCLIEHRMEAGASFDRASDEIFQIFSDKEVRRWQKALQRATKSKYELMKHITIITSGIAACLIMITSLLQAQEYPSIKPLLNVKIASPFGMRMHPVSKEYMNHRGVDLKAPAGTPVMATADGVVSQVSEDPMGYGKYLVIDHKGNFQTKYAQLSKVHIKAGAEVKRGDIIGLVGSSGASTAPHLHYEVLKEKQAVNPEDYMQ